MQIIVEGLADQVSKGALHRVLLPGDGKLWQEDIDVHYAKDNLRQ